MHRRVRGFRWGRLTGMGSIAYDIAMPRIPRGSPRTALALKRGGLLMISAWWLLLICPACTSLGLLFGALFGLNRRG